jgi:RNA polymerase sigma-70 factor (ECF subfamily)
MDVTRREVDEAAFTAFVTHAEPRLRRALVAVRGPEDGRDAAAESLAWAWQNWDLVTTLDNPVGYLFRVGQSRSRPRLQGHLPDTRSHRHTPYVEPALSPALAKLTPTQRAAVLLHHGCDWTYAEVAEALGITKTAVGTHIARALKKLRRDLNVEVTP